MGLSVKKGTITARTSTGSQAYTGVGFTPKVIFFWGTLQTADGAGTPNGSHFGVACLNGASYQQWSMAACEDNAAATANAGSYTSATNAVSIHSNGSGAAASLTGQAAVTAFGSDGFTLNWVDAATSAWIIHYLALGGTDITDVAAGATNSLAATGNQDFTGPGFTPDLVCIGHHQGNAGVRTGGGLNLGFADGSLNQWGLGWNSTDAAAAVTLGGAYDTANIIAAPSGAGTTSPGTWNWRGALTAMLANGFRINWSVAAAARPMNWLAIAGALEVRVGTDSMKTGTTGDKDTTLTGITPRAVMLTSNGRAAGGSYPDVDSADLWNWLFGGFTTSDEGCIWMCSDDASDPSVARGATTQTKALQERNMAGTTVVEADSSLLSNGFRLGYTTVKASQADVLGYVAFGEVPVASSRLKRWNGSAWVVANLKRHNGSIWTPATLKKLP